MTVEWECSVLSLAWYPITMTVFQNMIARPRMVGCIVLYFEWLRSCHVLHTLQTAWFRVADDCVAILFLCLHDLTQTVWIWREQNLSDGAIWAQLAVWWTHGCRLQETIQSNVMVAPGEETAVMGKSLIKSRTQDSHLSREVFKPFSLI